MRTGAILILASAVFFLRFEAVPNGPLGLFFLVLGCLYLLCGTVLHIKDWHKNAPPSDTAAGVSEAYRTASEDYRTPGDSKN